MSGSALEGVGLTLSGVLAIADYDARVPAPFRSSALLPNARTARVLGAPARALADALEREGVDLAAPDPIDAFCERAVARYVADLEREGTRSVAISYRERRAGVFADFVELARAAGLGTPGRIRLLLHPDFGPWVSIRAVVLSERSAPATPPLDFDPCRDCAAPCQTASDPRGACVVAPEQAPPAWLRAHFDAASQAMAKSASDEGSGTDESAS